MTVPAMLPMIDAIRANVGHIPAGAQKVAGYVTGTGDVPWSASDWSRFPRAGHVRIDQTPGLAVYAAGGADVADVEAHAGTVAAAVPATKERISHGHLGCVYGTESTLTSAAGELRAAGVDLGHVYCWVANWNLSETQASAMLGKPFAGMRVAAVQWASPASNPRTVVPGGSVTLAVAQVDLSVSVGSWFPPPGAGTTPRKYAGIVVDSGLNAHHVTSTDRRTWST